MLSQDIAKMVDCCPIEMRRMCSRYRGHYIVWMVRQLLMKEWVRISELEREFLLDTLRLLLRSGIRYGGMLDDLYANGTFVFPHPHLNILAKIHKPANPFGV